MKLTNYLSGKEIEADPLYQTPTLRRAMESSARLKYASTVQIYKVLKKICAGQALHTAFPEFDSGMLLRKRLESAIYDHMSIVVRKELQAMERITDQRSIEFHDFEANLKLIHSYYKEISSQAPELLEHINIDPTGSFLKSSGLFEIINSKKKSALGVGRKLDYYLAFIAAAFLYCRKSDHARRNQLFKQADDDLTEASILCVCAEENDSAGYHQAVRRKLKQAGGKAKSKGYGVLHEILANLIRTHAPEGGWVSQEDVIDRTWFENRNGIRETVSIPILLHREQRSRNLSVQLTESNMDSTLLKWIRKVDMVASTFNNTKKQKNQ
ncbi:hypothetical protein [Castellaniella sp.]|uniref:hypothetical protein n=1 Tax=Castellaniella sp. TaxID=1955812 RepID=UPI002AFF5023|nr:hypothetical protein [Castellaniella sp.]